MRTATALLLASLGLDIYHGSIFTMAQAAPAPGHGEYAARPRYYFPRHVKRQIVTNATTPATSSSDSGLLGGVGQAVGSVVDGAGNAVDALTGDSGSASSSASAYPQSVLSTTTPEPASSSDRTDAGLLGDVVGGVTGVVGDVVSGVAAPVVTGVVPGVVSDVGGVATGVVAPLATGVVPGVVSGLAGPSGVVPNVVSGLVGPSGVVPNVVSGLAGASGVVRFVVFGLAGPSGVVPNVVSGLAGPSGVVPDVVSGLVGPSGVVPEVVSGVGSGAVAPLVTGVVPGVVSAVTGPSGAVPEVVSGVIGPSGALPVTIVPPIQSITPAVESSVPPLTSAPGSIIVGLSTVLSGSNVNPLPAPTSSFAVVPIPSGAGITGPGTGIASPTPVPTSEVNQTVPEEPSYSVPATFSIEPTGSDSNTVQAPPETSLLAAPAPSESPTATASGIPTSMPKVIAPPGGPVAKPANSTLIQIGFTHELNYAFVSTNPTSAQQIFTFLPQGVAYGLLVDGTDTKMFNIQPYDTSKSLGYITTLALMYIPTDLVNQLAVDLHTPNSGVYNNPDSTIAQLMSFINPAIPLIAGQPMDGTYSGNAAAATTTVDAPGGGAPFGGDSGSSNTVKSSAIAIGTATTAGVVLYGAAMGLVARRYKKKRQSHSRNSSLTGSEPAWMSGAGYSRNSHGSGSSQGRSIRSQGISAPVMAENSLGWN